MWPLVPLYGIEAGACECGSPNCRASGKHPRLRRWQHRAVTDPGLYRRWNYARPAMNWGLLLQPGGFCDVEFDSEAGRATAGLLLGGFLTPTYASTRSVHRIFSLPASASPSLAVTRWRGLEIRTGTHTRAAQSVVPPSRHASGCSYLWEPYLGPQEVAVAPLPPDLLAAILG